MPSYDMSQEKEMVLREVIPEGERTLKILNVEEGTSKAGNPQIIWTIMDVETEKCDVLYTIATQGKRWALKSILFACGVPIADGEIYSFEMEDLIDKTIIGFNKHVTEDWINSKGENVPQEKNKFTKFMPINKSKTATDKNGDEIPF
ncbi:MAG: hypothetical protein ABSE82_08305 [Nitrososphaerales archaeon]